MSASPHPNDSPAGVKIGAQPPAPLERASARLKSAGLRVTRPRLAILAELIRRKEPASIEQIHGELSAGRCDRVTVYRCLAAFEEIGLVRRAFFLNGAWLYAINLGEPARYHVVCKRSQRVDEIDADARTELGRALQNVEEKLRARGYTETGHIVEFFGVAPAAAKV